jgi:hypothetical protein
MSEDPDTDGADSRRMRVALLVYSFSAPIVAGAAGFVVEFLGAFWVTFLAVCIIAGLSADAVFRQLPSPVRVWLQGERKSDHP